MYVHSQMKGKCGLDRAIMIHAAACCLSMLRCQVRVSSGVGSTANLNDFRGIPGGGACLGPVNALPHLVQQPSGVCCGMLNKDAP